MHHTSSHITLAKGQHRETTVIWLQFSGRRDWLELIKGLGCIQYSRTHRTWYIPYDKVAYNDFKQLALKHNIPVILSGSSTENKAQACLGETIVQECNLVPQEKQSYNKDHHTTTPTVGQSPTALLKKESNYGNAQDQLVDQRPTIIEEQAPRSSNLASSSSQEAGDIGLRSRTDQLDITYSGKYFVISMPYKESYVAKLKNLCKAWWHKDHKKWMVYASYDNHVALQRIFDPWSEDEFQRIDLLISRYDRPTKIILYQLATNKDQIYIEVKGRRKVIGPIMKCSCYQKTDRAHTYRVAFSIEVIDQLLEAYQALGIPVENRLQNKNSLQTQTKDNLESWLKYYLSRYQGRQLLLSTSLAKVMVQSRMSRNTIKSYVNEIIQFDKYLQKQRIQEVNQSVIDGYMQYLAGGDLSDSSIQIAISSLKYYFKKVSLNEQIEVSKIVRPKKGKELPKITSAESVLRMIEVTKNEKHKNIIVALYSSGLRLSELINLKLSDILWDRRQVIVRSGKGKKDRSVMLSDWLTDSLQEYFHEYKPVTYLFESRKAGEQYSASSVQSIVRKAAQLANISQHVTPHVLRHCFATHLHDDCIDIGVIQKLLGHKHITTTLIYTHISTSKAISVESPMDRLMRQKVGKNGK